MEISAKFAVFGNFSPSGFRYTDVRPGPCCYSILWENEIVEWDLTRRNPVGRFEDFFVWILWRIMAIWRFWRESVLYSLLKDNAIFAWLFTNRNLPISSLPEEMQLAVLGITEFDFLRKIVALCTFRFFWWKNFRFMELSRRCYFQQIFWI